MLSGVVGDDHHVELVALHGLADCVEIGDGGEVTAILAQEHLHVCVAVVAKVLGLDGCALRRQRSASCGWNHRALWRLRRAKRCA